MKPNFRFMLLLAVFGMLVLLSWPGELLGQEACVDNNGSFIPPKCDGDQDGYLKDTKKCLKDYGENCPIDCDDSVTGDFCSEPPDSPEIRYITTYWDFPYGDEFIDQSLICKREVTNQHGRYYKCPYEGTQEQTIQIGYLSGNYTQLLKNGDDTVCQEFYDIQEGGYIIEATSTGMLLGFGEDCGVDTCQSGAHTGFSISELPEYKLAFVATDFDVDSPGYADPFAIEQELEYDELIITFRKVGTMRKLAKCRYGFENAADKMKLHARPCDDPSSCVPAP